MAKGNANPADAYRKAQKHKELVKNRNARKTTREEKMAKKDTYDMEEEIRILTEKEDSGKMTDSERNKLTGLRFDLARVKKVKEAYLKQHPDEHAQVYRKRKQPSNQQQAEDAPRDASGRKMKTRRIFDERTGLPRHPERSLYYDKVMNPYGVPPPGMPYAQRPLLPGEVDSEEEFDDDEDDAEMPENDASDDDIPMPEDDLDDIPMPPGPPPGSSLDPNEDVEDDLEVPLPAGLPPIVEDDWQPPLPPGPPPPRLPVTHPSAPSGFPPVFAANHSLPPQIFLPPPPPGGPAILHGGIPPPPPGGPPLAFHVFPGGVPPPPPGGPPILLPVIPPPPPGGPPHLHGIPPPPPGGPGISHAPRGPALSYAPPLPPAPYQMASSHRPPVAHRPFIAPASAQLPKRPNAPAAVISAEPELIDFRKEATAFVPTAIKRKRADASQSSSTGVTGSVRMDSAADTTEESEVGPAAPPDLLETLRKRMRQ